MINQPGSIEGLETLQHLQSVKFEMVDISDNCEFLVLRNAVVKDVTVYLDSIYEWSGFPPEYPPTQEGLEMYIRNVQFPASERVEVILSHDQVYFEA